MSQSEQSIINNNNKHESKTNTMTNESNLAYSAFNIDEELLKHLNNIEDSLSDIIPVQSSLNKINTQKITNVITLITPQDSQLMEIELALAVKGYPDILSYLNFDTKQLTLPDWIDYKMLRDYFEYVKLCYEIQDNDNHSSNTQYNYNFKKLTQLSNYFNNDTILSYIIKLNIEPNINIDNCFNLIADAFNYCSSNHSLDIINAKASDKLRANWFKLFLKLRTFIINNLLSMLSNQRLMKLPIKLLEDIIEAFLLEIYSKGIEISNDQAVKLIKIILSTKKETMSTYNDNESLEEIEEGIIALLKEITDIQQDKLKDNNASVNELKYIKPPTFSIDLLNDINYNYQETNVLFHKQELLFITRYDKNEDMFTVSIKLNSVNRIEVFSFLSFAFIEEDKDYDQFHSKTLNTGMSHSVFKINSYKVYLHYMKNIKDFSSIHLRINLKFHIIQSFILCYMKSCFSRICKRPSLSQLPLSVFQSLLNDIVPEKEEEPLLAIMNWLSNEDNYSEDIIPMLENINWNRVPLGRIFEFVIRYPKLLSNSPIENNIIAAIFSKANNKIIEMKKDKLFQEAQYYERQYTQFSYEGDNDKFTHIAAEENMKINKDNQRADITDPQKKNDPNTDQKSHCNEAVIDDNQIEIISYFFVNLVECSKRLNYQRILSENKDFKAFKSDYKGEENKKKIIDSYKGDKLKIFSFNQSKKSMSESIQKSSKKNIHKIRSRSNSKIINNNIPVISCNGDQIIQMPSISHISDNKSDSRISNISLSVSHISNISHKTSKLYSNSNTKVKGNIQSDYQPVIKLKSIALNNHTARNNTSNNEKG